MGKKSIKTRRNCSEIYEPRVTEVTWWTKGQWLDLHLLNDRETSVKVDYGWGSTIQQKINWKDTPPLLFTFTFSFLFFSNSSFFFAVLSIFSSIFTFVFFSSTIPPSLSFSLFFHLFLLSSSFLFFLSFQFCLFILSLVCLFLSSFFSLSLSLSFFISFSLVHHSHSSFHSFFLFFFLSGFVSFFPHLLLSPFISLSP